MTRRLVALAVSAALLSGCYLGRDRQTRRFVYVIDAVFVATGAGLVIGGAVHDASCDEPHCEQTARNLYGSGGALMMLGTMLALGNYLFAPQQEFARATRSPRRTNAPLVDRP
jgi:hypothetical protein